MVSIDIEGFAEIHWERDEDSLNISWGDDTNQLTITQESWEGMVNKGKRKRARVLATGMQDIHSLLNPSGESFPVISLEEIIYDTFA